MQCGHLSTRPADRLSDRALPRRSCRLSFAPDPLPSRLSDAQTARVGDTNAGFHCIGVQG